MDSDLLVCLLQLLIPLQFFWALSLGLSKTSILLLYSNVFVVRPVVWTARCTIAFIILWVIGTIMAGCLICRPFAMNWDQSIPGGKCGNQVLSFTITGVLNLLTDVVVLLLPMPYLYGLQMRTYKKVVLMGVFGIGLLYVSLQLSRSCLCPKSARSMLTVNFQFQHMRGQWHPHPQPVIHGLHRHYLFHAASQHFLGPRAQRGRDPGLYPIDAAFAWTDTVRFRRAVQNLRIYQPIQGHRTRKRQ